MFSSVLPRKKQRPPWLDCCSLGSWVRQPLVNGGLVLLNFMNNKIKRRVVSDRNHPRPLWRNPWPASLLRCRRLLQRPAMTVRIMHPMTVFLELIIRTLVLQDLVHLFRTSVYAKFNYLRRLRPPPRCISGQLNEPLFSTYRV
jgi:hypothetical protein